MRHTIPKRTVFPVLLGIVLLTGALSSAVATTGNEPSIYDWWRNVVPNTAWGSSYATATPLEVWNLQIADPQYWAVTPQDKGYWELRVEYAGNAGSNTFGWFASTSPTAHNQIFAGGATAGSTYTTTFTSAQSIGFYMGTNNGAGVSYYTDASLNDSSGDARQVRVFEDPRGAGTSATNPYYNAAYESAWVLCWEDLAANTSSYNAAWTAPYLTTGNCDPYWVNPLDWGGGPEPDYQDMIVTFRLEYHEGTQPPTPELSTFLLIGLSLAAIPVLRRRRRS